jgi:hypothetical protein
VYDSADRVLQYQRGQFDTAAGPIVTAIGLPHTDASRNYHLDGLGNWKNTAFAPVQSDGSIGATVTDLRRHNSTNELTRFNPTESLPVNVSYDHGNNAASRNPPLVQQRGNGNIARDGTLVYQYDALNRLIYVLTPSGEQIVEYFYDALNRRVYKLVGPDEDAGAIYYYDGVQCVEEGDISDSSLMRQFAWWQYVDELIRMTTYETLGVQNLAPGSYYPLSDLLYRSVALTDGSGNIVEAYDTDAYGNTIIFTAAGSGGNWFANDATQSAYSVCEYIFTGRQYDPETGNYYFRARYYHPELEK